MEKVIFKCYSEGDKSNDDMLFVNSSDIRKIRTVYRGNYTKLFVEYYDDEFCMNTTFICDYVEPIECFDCNPHTEEKQPEDTPIDYVKESNGTYRIVLNYQFDMVVDEGEYYAVKRKL